jgi:hypothetical protein
MTRDVDKMTSELRAYSSLEPVDRASFATSIRLLSCLVTESLVDAWFYPLRLHGLAGFAAIQLKDQPGGVLDSRNTLAILPLLHVPIFRKGNDALVASTPTIALLDPLDAAPLIYTFGKEAPREEVGRFH